ncbi:M protein trans-acting positive regulator [Enterococcus mundtii]|uniref:helix-turn-helix domain-containing protein n=1 Tax=Enterococcus mundtii TaxID=53346 RepID=UPI00136E8FA5|nr:helix-turn-helix domain-containing protein [Enterococcus mundtii]NAE15692.1 M protein trans-acting positive regulator [Enterococcus mundtii]
MHILFDHLVMADKTKRWLVLLATLEEEEHVIAHTLVEQTGFGRRTIIEDMKAIKDYFGERIHLIGDEKGYHFSFLNPKVYYEKKQALLDKEKLFLLVDQLAAGTCLDNQQWMAYLDVSSTRFQRMKRQLQTLLKTYYGIQIESKNNQLWGEEAGIRQFLYDFYFTLPLYPRFLSEHIQDLHQEKVAIQDGPWHLDQTLFNQWLRLAKQRVDQGHCLHEQVAYKQVQTTLTQALDQQVSVALPGSEKAALFLLSLDERQFLNPMTQQVFIRTFSPASEYELPMGETEGLTYDFFEILLFLMEVFFQLPTLEAPEQVPYANSEEPSPLDVLMKRFLAEKKKYSQTIYVSYQLVGPRALTRWIKQEVETILKKSGLQAVEAAQMNPLGLVRYVQIVNQPQARNARATIELPYVPSKEKIAEVLSVFSESR